MNILIVGAGTVGYSLAEQLSRQGHQVSVVERNEALCNKINEKLDVFTVNGVGTSPQVLESAGIRTAHTVIAVTPWDDTNLVVCNFAKQLGVQRRIARKKSAEINETGTAISLTELGVSHVIEPEKEVVRNILQYVDLPGVTETANFHSGSVFLRGYRITEDMPVVNQTLYDLNTSLKLQNILIVLIIRAGMSIIPTGTDTIMPGDEIIAIMPAESIDQFRQVIDRLRKKLKKVIVSGDTLTAVLLSRELKAMAEQVIMIDPDPKHAQIASTQLDGVDVLNGDCTETEMLQEVHAESASFFIAVGKEPEDNILACLLAKAEGAGEVVAVSANERHARLFQQLGVDHIIFPQAITSQSIMDNILHIPIGALFMFRDADVDILRVTVEKGSKMAGKPLRELTRSLMKSAIVGSICKQDRVIIPSGETVIEPGDEVLVLCHRDNSQYVNNTFRAGFHLNIGLPG